MSHKTGETLGLFQKGEKHKAANYHTVFLTSVTCKVLEHIIHSNVMNHFDKHMILKDNQHGFRKKRACETQLIITIQEIASRLANDKQVDVILLDFENAFDKVSHRRLRPLRAWNNTNRWIRSFLEGRKQTVLLEGSRSKEAEILSGVPQGTVLGPLLFLAYINDLPDVCKSSDTRLFADDSLLFRTINSQQDDILLQ